MQATKMLALILLSTIGTMIGCGGSPKVVEGTLEDWFQIDEQGFRVVWKRLIPTDYSERLSAGDFPKILIEVEVGGAWVQMRSGSGEVYVLRILPNCRHDEDIGGSWARIIPEKKGIAITVDAPLASQLSEALPNMPREKRNGKEWFVTPLAKMDVPGIRGERTPL